MITKEMLKRCQNELKQAFCALPDDVRNTISINYNFAETLVAIPERWDRKIGWMHHAVVRLSPDTPTEPEWVEYHVTPNKHGILGIIISRDINYTDGVLYVSSCVSHTRFIGIIYRGNDGIETLRTSIDAAFGTPVRVRFSKPQTKPTKGTTSGIKD